MSESQVDNMPKVQVVLGIDPSLDRILDADDSLNRIVRQEVLRGLAEVLETLGIPGEPVVETTALKENATLSGRFMQVFVNGQLCRYSDELLQRVHSYVLGISYSQGATPSRILTWLKERFARQDDGTNIQSVEFLGLACLEMVKRKPSVLLGSANAAAYQASLPDLTDEADLQSAMWPLDPSWLLPVLAKVVDLRISIGDKQTVAEVVRKGLTKERSQEDIAEDLITALRPDPVEIQLSPGYLKQIMTADSGRGHDKFALMRDGLFYELGVRYPDFRFMPVENLKPNSFAIKINHLTAQPWIGLQPDQCLVNDTLERLRLRNIDASAAINPANGNECALIDVALQSVAESAGLTTWNQVEYLVLCFSTDLRANSACFVHRQTAQEYLEQLDQAFPALVKAIQEKVSVEQITRVLRSLISEEITIRNLRSILELMLDYDYIVTDPAQYIIFDDRMPVNRRPDAAWLDDPTNLASFVRAGLKRYISHKYTRGQNALIVYLLDPAVERLLSEHQQEGIDLPEDKRDQILEAVRIEVDALPETTSMPAVLTTIDVRPCFREIVSQEFPRLPVLAYQELSPDLNIQPIARISVDS